MGSFNQKKRKAILGLMNCGPNVQWGARVTTIPEFNKLLDAFQEKGYDEVDTARSYQHGEQEAFTAAAHWKERGLKLATKVYPITPGLHKPDQITIQFYESLAQLKTDCFDIFYLHGPDRSVPFTPALEILNTFYNEGRFKKLGLSNYSAFEVAEIVVTCKLKGWVRPTIYQAIYNAITRSIEDELVPACRRYGLDIVIYNPLAGGFFTGKYKSTQDPAMEVGSISATTVVGQVYQGYYCNDPYFHALELISPIIASHNLTLVEVGFRWAVHHSKLKMLDGDDGIVFGASSVEQLKESLEDIEKGPLPVEVVKVLDKAAEITRIKWPKYFHFDFNYGYNFDAK